MTFWVVFSGFDHFSRFRLFPLTWLLTQEAHCITGLKARQKSDQEGAKKSTFQPQPGEKLDRFRPNEQPGHTPVETGPVQQPRGSDDAIARGLPGYVLADIELSVDANQQERCRGSQTAQQHGVSAEDEQPRIDRYRKRGAGVGGDSTGREEPTSLSSPARARTPDPWR